MVWRGKSGEGLITWQTKKSNQMRELKAEPITEKYFGIKERNPSSRVANDRDLVTKFQTKKM